jgi:hypothetical protein
MSDSTGKAEFRDSGVKAQAVKEALDPDAGAALDMKELEAVSAGNAPLSSDEQVLYGLNTLQAQARQSARDAYRKTHPYAHPDDVEKAIDGAYAVVGLEGKSGA